jgi:methyl-accepting chemotaxis protein
MHRTLSIRSKISMVVAGLLLVMAGLGLLAVREMNSINANAVEIQANRLPSVRAVAELKSSTINYRNILRKHLLAETAQAKLAAERRLGEVVQDIARVRQSYERLITFAEDRSLYGEWSRQWDAYIAGAQQVLALSRESSGNPPHEANELNESRVNDLGKAADITLEKNIDLNNRAADEAGRASTEVYQSAFRWLAGILLLSIALGIAAAIYMVRDVARGIASVVAPMQALSSGDLRAEISHRGEPTEIGSMADALQIFKEALIASEAVNAAAAREAEASIQRGQRVEQTTRQFEVVISELVGSLAQASKALEASAGTLTDTAERGHQVTSTVAVACETASTNVQAVAAAAEQMSSSVDEISRQVQDSARIAGAAVEQASATNQRVGELAKAAARIGDVVEIINTIAGQTNLLALNATIEAARAGDAGRGFAVVASEVKALAEQTAKATGEISQQITSIQAATDQSVKAIREIGGTIGRMSEIASTIAAAVEQQGAATREISRNVQQAAQGTEQVSSNITDVQRSAGETGTASQQVLSAAQSLSRDSARLSHEVGHFLSSVRAA